MSAPMKTPTGPPGAPMRAPASAPAHVPAMPPPSFDATSPTGTPLLISYNARAPSTMLPKVQQRLEQGYLGTQPMTPDQATEWLNQSEAQGRTLVLDRFEQQLPPFALASV